MEKEYLQRLTTATNEARWKINELVKAQASKNNVKSSDVSDLILIIETMSRASANAQEAAST